MRGQCDGCGADREAGQPCDRGCSAAKRRSREPGAIIGDYVPEVGDLVCTFDRGYGMVSAIDKTGRIEVTLRRTWQGRAKVTAEAETIGLGELILAIPHEAKRMG